MYPSKKRVVKGNIGESFTIQIEGDNYTQAVRLLEYVGTGDGAKVVFSNPHFPGGEWGKITCDRFSGKIWYKGRIVKIIR